jgi:hypothetical protein
MPAVRWYERPETAPQFLRRTPRLASWNKTTHPDQIRLREYLDDTESLLATSMPCAPWALRLDVGLPAGRDLIDMADLDNYAFPLARHVGNNQLVSVWCTKRHSKTSTVRAAVARETLAPEDAITVRTSGSAGTTAYKEQVRAGVSAAEEIPGGAVRLQISYAVGPRRNWLNLWKPTIDALDPLLGRTRETRDWHPRDGRITELGLHLSIDSDLGNDVVMSIAAEPVRLDRAMGAG